MRADARANRLAIVLAARRLYAAQGPDVSMSAIASAAGVGIATLYRHFPTPDALIEGIGEHLSDELVAICSRRLPEVRATPEQGWRAFVDDVVALEFGAIVPTLAVRLGDGVLAPRLEELRARAFRQVDAVLDTAKAAGLVRPDVPVVRFQMGLGMITRPLPAAADVLAPGEIGWLVEVYLRGLRP